MAMRSVELFSGAGGLALGIDWIRDAMRAWRRGPQAFLSAALRGAVLHNHLPRREA
jgi:hypothetical protein